MQYHAHALAASGVGVDLIGYEGAPLPKFLADDPRATVHRLANARLRFRITRSKVIPTEFSRPVDALKTSIRFGGMLLRIPET